MSRPASIPQVPGTRVVVVDEAKLIALQQDGLTHKELAERFRLSLDRVGTILRAHGIRRQVKV